jgi:hypothetical protein
VIGEVEGKDGRNLLKMEIECVQQDSPFKYKCGLFG